MKIDKSKYEGYLWYSNKPEPQVLENEEFELEIANSTNPFIIEGQLYDGQISYSIKFVDGEYWIVRYDLSELQDVEHTDHSFYAHRMPNKKLKFRQYWRLQEDENCDGMQVLQPAEYVFIGFENISNKEE